jgi:hypothetical protein
MPAVDHFNIGDQDDDLLNFDQLSECLIVGAVSTNADKDVGDNLDENELPPAITVQAPSGPLTITIPPLPSATLSPQATQAKRTCIPLKILFDCPTDIDMHLEAQGMNSLWRGGIEDLEEEMEAYNILNESTKENSDGIHWYSNYSCKLNRYMTFIMCISTLYSDTRLG